MTRGSLFMRIAKLALLASFLCVLPSCSPRDFLTRRLAADLISSSDAFKTPQTIWLTTGIVSNKDFTTPESMVLQRRGWIIGNEQKCPVGIEPPPCWDILLSPLGVDTIRPLIASGSKDSGSLGSGSSGNGAIAIQAARREVIAITGMSKSGNLADVEFTWRWVSLNKVGAALYDSGVRYRSTVGFCSYDDGWRVATARVRSGQTLDEALRNSELTAP
jgi:hypothetical protein